MLILFIAGVLMLNAAGGDSVIAGETGLPFLRLSTIQARLLSIGFTLLLIATLYRVASGVIGRWWALLPAFLLASTPLVLAFGHYGTRDAAVALGVLLSLALFVRALERPAYVTLIAAGAALAATTYAAPELLMLPLLFAGLAGIYFVVNRPYSFWRTIGIFFASWLVILWGILFLTTASLPAEDALIAVQASLHERAPTLNDITTSLFKTPATKPFGHYLGLFLIPRTPFPAFGPSFLITLFLKVPVAIGVAVLFGILLSAWHGIRTLPALFKKRGSALKDYLTTTFFEFSMLLFTVLYIGAGLATHVVETRFLLPVLPFLYIAAVASIKYWFGFENIISKPIAFSMILLAKNISRILTKAALLALALVSILISALIASPHFISYYNIAAGGTARGYAWNAGSDYDLGQDLYRLERWMNANLPADARIAVDHIGRDAVSDVLGPRAEEWWSARGNPALEGISWLAVSVSRLEAARRDEVLTPQHRYLWLEGVEPTARSGTSLFIYHFSSIDVARR